MAFLVVSDFHVRNMSGPREVRGRVGGLIAVAGFRRFGPVFEFLASTTCDIGRELRPAKTMVFRHWIWAGLGPGFGLTPVGYYRIILNAILFLGVEGDVV